MPVSRRQWPLLRELGRHEEAGDRDARSRLALWQAEHVKRRLEALHPGLQVELLPLTTRGDELLDRRLDKIGGKGLFVKELETALAEGRADIAVHSMKDVPAELPPGFVLARDHGARGPARRVRLEPLSRPGRAAGGRARRHLQPAARRRSSRSAIPRSRSAAARQRRHAPAKLDRGEYDAIVLAAAGLKRLGLAARITRAPGDRGEPAGARAGRARHRVPARARRRARAARAARDRATDASACAPSARSAARSAAAARLPLAAYARVHCDGSCGCARWSLRRRTRVIARRARGRCAPTRQRSATRAAQSCAARAPRRSSASEPLCAAAASWSRARASRPRGSRG